MTDTNYLIAPSILSANFAKLGEEVDNVLEAGADWIHFDVMDNHYVPNLTIGPMICKALRDHGVTAPIDVHLMVEPVDRIIPDFAEAGASMITFHPEASKQKIVEARKIIDQSGRDIRLEVDGGVKIENIGELAALGADTFVAGSAIFNQDDYAKVISEMRADIARAIR